MGPEGLAIMNNAPNKEAALKFVEYMMDVKFKAIFVNGGFFPYTKTCTMIQSWQNGR